MSREMDSIIKSIIIMKIGFHVNEMIEEIINRKQKEQSICGKIFWGYSGMLCNPLTQINPFVQEMIEKHNMVPLLVMILTPSRFTTSLRIAQEYSTDGKTWTSLPPGVIVTSSKYAIVCHNLKLVDQELDLSRYKVATGIRKGELLSRYLRHRIDKACAIFWNTNNLSPVKPELTKINYIANLQEPYAVILR